jgi:deazaflavin-dependent oxidoreductase (nitroreductase family)
MVTAGSRFANKRGLYLGPRATRVHVAIYRLSRGRVAGHIPGMPSARILLLEHTGARTGVRRTSPVMYHQEADHIAIAASKGGQPTHPAWFHNLKAHPDTAVQIGPRKRHVRARVATDEERNDLWPRFVAFYPDYAFFQRLAKDRPIPIIILEPRNCD